MVRRMRGTEVQEEKTFMTWQIQDMIEGSMSEQYQKKFLFHYSRNPRSASRLNVNLSCLQRERYMHVYI